MFFIYKRRLTPILLIVSLPWSVSLVIRTVVELGSALVGQDLLPLVVWLTSTWVWEVSMEMVVLVEVGAVMGSQISVFSGQVMHPTWYNCWALRHRHRGFLQTDSLLSSRCSRPSSSFIHLSTGLVMTASSRRSFWLRTILGVGQHQPLQMTMMRAPVKNQWFKKIMIVFFSKKIIYSGLAVNTTELFLSIKYCLLKFDRSSKFKTVGM